MLLSNSTDSHKCNSLQQNFTLKYMAPEDIHKRSKSCNEFHLMVCICVNEGGIFVTT